jgi:hypothetical protein
MFDDLARRERFENDFQIFLDALQHATALIEPHYFQLPVAQLEDPVYRERVYCYELYHRLREVLPGTFGYRLDGELDKSGHPLIHHAVGPVKPDFLVHERGVMNKNLVVIEVKPITVQNDGLAKDFKTLREFIAKAEYFRAIYLIYGDGPRIIENAVNRAHDEIKDLPAECFYLLAHSQPLSPAEIVICI